MNKATTLLILGAFAVAGFNPAVAQDSGTTTTTTTTTKKENKVVKDAEMPLKETGKAGKGVVKGTETVGKDIGKGTEKVGRGMVHGTEAVGKDIGKGFKDVGHGLGKMVPHKKKPAPAATTTTTNQ
jgi:hypothetical protein